MSISPAQVQDLRTSIRHRVLADPQSAHIPAHIIYSASEEEFILLIAGRAVAMDQDIAPLAHCLRAERAEPGYTARILATDTPCDIAALMPSERLTEERRRRDEARRARDQADAEAERIRRRNSILPPNPGALAALNLDDLL